MKKKKNPLVIQKVSKSTIFSMLFAVGSEVDKNHQKNFFFFFLASPEAVTACTTLCVLVMLLMGRYVSTEQTG